MSQTKFQESEQRLTQEQITAPETVTTNGRRYRLDDMAVIFKGGPIAGRQSLESTTLCKGMTLLTRKMKFGTKKYNQASAADWAASRMFETVEVAYRVTDKIENGLRVLRYVPKKRL